MIFDAYSGAVTDVTPGRESSGAFYLGEAVADQIIGRAGNDFIEGFGGDDILDGGAGADAMLGGAGGNDVYSRRWGRRRSDRECQRGQRRGVFDRPLRCCRRTWKTLVLQGSADLQGYGNSEANTLYGNSGYQSPERQWLAPMPCSAVPATTCTRRRPAGDAVIENANEGNDTVFSTFHFAAVGATWRTLSC